MTEEIVRFYSELKRRKVIRVGMFYAIVAFALLQIGDVAFEPLELPAWVLRVLISWKLAMSPKISAEIPSSI